MITISVISRKGGTGKTTTAVNLSAALAMRNYPVLLIDCDSQANATLSVGISPTSNHQLFENIVSTKFDKLDIMPACREYSKYEEIAVRESYALNALEQKMFHMKHLFKIIDCPPTLSWLTITALIASDLAIVPMQAEFFSLSGLNEVLNIINALNGKRISKCKLHGILITMYNIRPASMQNICNHVHNNFAVYNTKIPRNIKLAEATMHGVPCILWDKRCSGSLSYQEFTAEFLDSLENI